ncbi:MAG: metalloregulator ArsR/SmtB family transcription factor [Clostridiales bacterium]|nr:metalloregulator ArsR/SmtB family transcription factor [Clostridiales bacterium]
MNKKYIVQARVFKAMSDENRLKILELLHEKDYNASELLEEMNFGQSTLSHHMRILLSAGIIQSRKNGKWTYYSLQKDAYEDMIAWMQQYL